MDSASHDMAVTLCCAPEDAAHLRPLVKHLRRGGVSTTLLEGINEDPHKLGASLDQESGAHVFVVCLSEMLGPSEFRRIAGIYSARKGPQHYLAELLVEPDEILAMAETVNMAILKATATNNDPRRRAPAEQNSGRSNRFRDVVGVTDISAVGSDGTAGRNKRGRPKREPSVAGPYLIPAREQGAKEPLPKPFPKADPDPDPAPETDSEAPAKAIAAPPSQSSNAWVPVVLFLILVAIAGTAWLIFMQDQQEQEAATPAPGRGAPVATDAPPQPSVADAAGAIAKPSDPPSATDTGETSGQGGGTETGGDEESRGDTGSGGERDTDVEEAEVIREAIANGDMRAIDLILVARPGELAAWRDASTACRNNSFRGVRGWRLPSLDELKTLRGARMLDRARFWSSTLATKVGSGRDHVYVLDLAERTLEPVAKDATDVHVLCVRALSVD